MDDETQQRGVKAERDMSVPEPAHRPSRIPLMIGGGAVGLLLLGVLLVRSAESKTNHVALSADARPVSIVDAKSASYRPFREYVGTLDPWVRADIGPQIVSAYVDTVLVRPGAVVKKGEVLATLDCRNASATAQAVAMQARALDARQQAVAHESTRIQGLLDGGFVSANEAEQKAAQSEEQQAQVLAEKARLLGTSLEVNDCVLRSPFDGEIATRTMDPGGFARPGVPIVSVVDRRTVRVVADAPEVDFAVVAAGTPVSLHAISTGKDFTATVARRAPAADPATRTVHFELDVPDDSRDLPVGTTAELRIDVGDPVPATEVPLYAATVRGTKATIFVVEGDVAHKRVVPMLGERAGNLYLDTSLTPGSKVVTEGRALLSDGDRVVSGVERSTPAAHASSSSSVSEAAAGKTP